MPETAYAPDPRPLGFQFLGNRHFPEGYPYDDLVSRRVVRTSPIPVTAPTLISPANPRKVGVFVRNNSASFCGIGPDSSVGTTVQTGFDIGTLSNTWAFFRTSAAIWANSSGVNVEVIEYFR